MDSGNVKIVKGLRFYDGRERNLTELGEPEVFKTAPARVGIGMGATLNMGNYNSARVDVYVEVPCYVEDLEQARRFVRDLAEKAMMEELDEIKSGQQKAEKSAPSSRPDY